MIDRHLLVRREAADGKPDIIVKGTILRKRAAAVERKREGGREGGAGLRVRRGHPIVENKEGCRARSRNRERDVVCDHEAARCGGSWRYYDDGGVSGRNLSPEKDAKGDQFGFHGVVVE